MAKKTARKSTRTAAKKATRGGAKKAARTGVKKKTTRTSARKSAGGASRKTARKGRTGVKTRGKTAAREGGRTSAARSARAARSGGRRKGATKRARRRPNPAFMKPLTPSPALAEVVGSKPLPRTEVTSRLWAYIKKKGLQDRRNRRQINADASRKQVFGGRSSVDMFTMTRLVNRHLK